jgi:hypothetical protein
LLTEVPDLPLAKSAELLIAVLAFEGRPVFPQLFESAMRSLITCYIAEGTDTPETQMFAKNPNATRWLQNVSGPRLTDLLVQGCSYSGSFAVARAWKWIAEASRTLYKRRPAVLPELCDALLRYSRQPFPEGVEDSLVQVLRRSLSEADSEVRQALSAKTLRFALDNVSFPLGAVVAEAFADVYAAATEKDGRSPSIFSVLFGSYDWDRGKDVRVSLIDAFLRSNWAPGDLAVAASNAGILRKIFKRLHRKYGGDDYISAMLRDLSQRSDSNALKVRERLQELVAAPNFYEEWD